MRQKHSIEAPNQVVATDTSGREKSRVLLLTCLGVTPTFRRQNSPRDLHFRPNNEKKKKWIIYKSYIILSWRQRQLARYPEFRAVTASPKRRKTGQCFRFGRAERKEADTVKAREETKAEISTDSEARRGLQ